jgi:methylthioribose-1-phosphate isomerase
VATIPHPEPISEDDYSAVELSPDGASVIMLDQRRLPLEEVYERLTSVESVAEAIRSMVVRGAPAIGISAAYGMTLAARGAGADAHRRVELAGRLLGQTRPTAVNLVWAVQRMLAAARGVASSVLHEVLADAARKLHRQDVTACRTIGRLGARHVPDGATILTHCNAGALATGGYGTALGVIRAARDAGKRVRVLADETRPYLQGARLTAWELHRSGIEVQVVCDSSAGHWFGRGDVTLTVVGADRIARNGDVANKIGTYGLACLSRVHDRPFYVAAPWSTVDLSCPSGSEIPIEQRDPREVSELGGHRGPAPTAAGEPGAAESVRVVPAGVGVLNPGFDVTPAAYVTSLFTERGVLGPVTPEGIVALAPADAIRSDAAGVDAPEGSAADRAVLGSDPGAP